MEGKGVRAGGKAKRELKGAGEERREGKSKRGAWRGKRRREKEEEGPGQAKGDGCEQQQQQRHSHSRANASAASQPTHNPKAKGKQAA